MVQRNRIGRGDGSPITIVRLLPLTAVAGILDWLIFTVRSDITHGTLVLGSHAFCVCVIYVFAIVHRLTLKRK